jgi:hypothetical protein
MPTLRLVCRRKQQSPTFEQNILGSRWRQIRALDAARAQVNNVSVAANSATGFCSPNLRRTQRRTECRRFFYAQLLCSAACRFLAAVCGEPQGSPVRSRSANPHTVRHPFRRSGWRLHAKGVVMENRFAVGGTEPRRCSLVCIGGVVPFSGRRAP